MKKQLTAIVLCIVLVFASMLCGCAHESESEKIRNGYKIDGCLKYYYLEEEDRYLIVGDIGEYNPETMVIPAYYKGKEVQVGYRSRKDWSPQNFAPSLVNVSCIYFPFGNYDDSISHVLPDGNNLVLETIYYCVDWVKTAERLFRKKGSVDRVLYCKYPAFLERKERMGMWLTETVSMENDYTMIVTVTIGLRDLYDYQYKIRVANTAYMFNYDGEPNGGYFFINNFDWGKKIDPAPYMPMRNGYEFKGWYKEPECINLWNFESDTLPQESEIGENPETKLYAGWEKK